MIYLQETQPPEINAMPKVFFLIVLCVVIGSVVLTRVYFVIEKLYASKNKKPFFLNVVLFKKELSRQQLSILKKEFSFYNNLNEKEQSVFRHRLATFINQKEFIGRDGLFVDDKMVTLISATAVMLTFGFRNYHLDLFDKIIIYPESYYSKINETYHKGETNPQLRAIVFSWEDFKQGYHIGDDNLNLGIHEFGHAIHLNAFSNNDISSEIFKSGFNQLTDYLQHHKVVREDLITSRYFRAYAYTNHFEFFAVLLENFIETPIEFKSNFPELYKHMKQMLNFNFANY
ncbi:zinc-dependent peptidase [Winogradskyella sp.]|jgi:Mlc titration factor MtfA (ptsG expression regulator)|uniref:zinc-dependent peptidase n=1 Tax=Winogradskyella sp. TaxID=1883156 RepID=UPI0025F3727F|nr:zinc-dependent peptidase [Winogradskyella sp.]MCT4629905.1 zinc-dependent peptidase [Winogradskyella sp.]